MHHQAGLYAYGIRNTHNRTQKPGATCSGREDSVARGEELRTSRLKGNTPLRQTALPVTMPHILVRYHLIERAGSSLPWNPAVHQAARVRLKGILRGRWDDFALEILQEHRRRLRDLGRQQASKDQHQSVGFVVCVFLDGMLSHGTVTTPPWVQLAIAIMPNGPIAGPLLSFASICGCGWVAVVLVVCALFFRSAVHRYAPFTAERPTERGDLRAPRSRCF